MKNSAPHLRNRIKGRFSDGLRPPLRYEYKDGPIKFWSLVPHWWTPVTGGLIFCDETGYVKGHHGRSDPPSPAKWIKYGLRFNGTRYIR